LYPASVNPPPTDAENVKTINSAVETLNRLAEEPPGLGADAAKRLADDTAALAKADEAARQRAETAFVPPLKIALDDLRDLLKAQEVTSESLPPTPASQ